MRFANTLIGALCVAATSACASSPEPAPIALGPAYPHLERVCVSADGLTGRITALKEFAVDTPGGKPVLATAARECFFPWVETAGWSRVETAAGDKNFIFGMADDGREHPIAAPSATIGAAAFDTDASGALTHATLGGPLTLSWTWDDAGRSLVRLDLTWRDAALTVGGKLGGTTRVHLARGGGGNVARVWESTVFSEADANHRLHEAWVADGPLEARAPVALGLSGIHPICPLSTREQWEDFDGVSPRVQRCLRDGVEWLRIERDTKGRILAIAEKTATSDRTIRFEWRGAVIPSRVWVESGGLPDGLDVAFDAQGLPSATRHFRLGRQEGLEVDWQRGRAKAARIWVEGTKGPERRIVDRTTVGAASGQPTLTIDLPSRRDGSPSGAWNGP